MSLNIVVPLDLSPPSMNALAFAIQLGAKTKGSLQALLVVSTGEQITGVPAYTQSAEFMSQLMKEAKTALDSSLATAAPKGVKIPGAIRHGSTADVIHAFAKETSADLLVMGTHGRGALGRFMLGSVAERVLRTADQPTIVVPASFSAPPTGPIVVAADFSAPSKKAIRKAAELAEKLGAELHALHVYTDPWADTRAYKANRGRVIPGDDIRVRALELGMQQLLTQEVSALAPNVKLTVVCKTGNPSEQIMDYAAAIEASLISLGSTGKGGVDRALLGSTTQTLVRTTTRPVLVIH